MRRALFLDRDGVINVDHAYVHRIDDFVFIPGIFELVRTANALQMPVVVVTNQAGIGRGMYSEQDFAALTAWMCQQFEQAGAAIDSVYHCPSHPTEGVGAYRVDSPMRKPHAGMLLAARDKLGLDMARSVLLGDKISDLQAGISAGVGLNLLLEGRYPVAQLPAGSERVASLADAQSRLLQHAGTP
jgi:D-glycero-D-manno-heptose 1,7-bisphosphate phosphatase